MEKLLIKNTGPLHGIIRISGSKNSALPIMCASLLTKNELNLSNVPILKDIHTLKHLLQFLGTEITDSAESPHNLQLCSKEIPKKLAPYEIVRKMRASVLVLGPMVARFGYAKVSLPGGCAIGTRPIDYHLKALTQMGASSKLEDGYVEVEAPNGLKGAEITFERVSVGATENILMAATLASGTTTLYNAAQEPEIIDLAECLIKMGANITGHGTSTIKIEGVASLHGTSHKIISDRIQAGTYAVAASITGGCLELTNIETHYIGNILEKIAETGSKITVAGDSVTINNEARVINPLKFGTDSYPGFPTDMQAQMMALLSVANGTSEITENIFENRFMHVPELKRMGAKIETNGATAKITGVKNLVAAPVMATDLRASVSLVLAGLTAKGVSILDRLYHLDRGYENIEQILNSCGAELERVK